jgi:hypothetical protein
MPRQPGGLAGIEVSASTESRNPVGVELPKELGANEKRLTEKAVRTTIKANRLILLEPLGMRTALLQKVLSCIMVVVVPAALFAADSGAAMLYSNGTARLNGSTLPRSSAIFPGDLVQTAADSVAKINAVGTSLMVLSDSQVRFEGNAVKLEHGGVAVSTSKAMATRTGQVTVTPSASVWTQFDVKNVDGQIQVTAEKGDLTVSDGAGTTTLAQGQQTTREQSEPARPEQSENNKKRRKRAAGAAPGASGGALDSPLAIGIGVGAVAGLATWVLIQGDEPVSPKQ